MNGRDVRRIQQHSLRRSMGFIPEDTLIFNESLSYNVCYGGDAELSADDAVALAAARTVGLKKPPRFTCRRERSFVQR